MHNTEKDILKAQNWLQGCGSSIKATGKFTIGMTTALISFQKKYGLKATGELDQETWKKLKSENSWWKKFKRKHCQCGCHMK